MAGKNFSQQGETRSPLKDKNLRTPGQSCEEERRRILSDKVEIPALVALVMLVFAGHEIWRWYWHLPPSPIVAALFAGGTFAFALYRFKKYLPLVRQLRLAADGEKAVGQFLDRLRTSGYEVLHDVPGQAFNIDHVLVGPGGVFSLETKTWTKPKNGKAEISFDGGELLKAGFKPDRDPIVQAKAQAVWLGRMIEEGTGWKVQVRPVLLIPGWFIEPPAERSGVWVLEPKALPSFLEHEQVRLESSV
jgi:hypothetical protein